MKINPWNSFVSVAIDVNIINRSFLLENGFSDTSDVG